MRHLSLLAFSGLLLLSGCGSGNTQSSSPMFIPTDEENPALSSEETGKTSSPGEGTDAKEVIVSSGFDETALLDNPYILSYRPYEYLPPILGLDEEGETTFSLYDVYQQEELADYRAAERYRSDLYCYDLMAQTLYTRYVDGDYDILNQHRGSMQPYPSAGMVRDGSGTFHMFRHDSMTGNGAYRYFTEIFAGAEEERCARFYGLSLCRGQGVWTKYVRDDFPYEAYMNLGLFPDRDRIIAAKGDIRFSCNDEGNITDSFYHIDPFTGEKEEINQPFPWARVVDTNLCNLPFFFSVQPYALPQYEQDTLLSDTFIYQTHYMYQDTETQTVTYQFRQVRYADGNWTVERLAANETYDFVDLSSVETRTFEDKQLEYQLWKEGADEPDFFVRNNGTVEIASFSEATGIPYARYEAALSYFGEVDFSYLTREGKLHILRHDDDCSGVTADYVEYKGYLLEGNFQRKVYHLVTDLKGTDYRTPEYEELLETISW